MKHYEFSDRFRALYDKAVKQYAAGRQDPGSYFSQEETTWLATNGLTPQNLFDYAEDHNNYDGEPGFERALAIELVRRDYFLNVQFGKSSGKFLDADKMPAKTDAVRGIEWLPRIIPKTRAKLRGELPSSLMYCCGGDRKFFKSHDIHPAEFMSLVWRSDGNDDAIVDWVARRSSSK